jgi:hypothetical protein
LALLVISLHIILSSQGVTAIEKDEHAASLSEEDSDEENESRNTNSNVENETRSLMEQHLQAVCAEMEAMLLVHTQASHLARYK